MSKRTLLLLLLIYLPIWAGESDFASSGYSAGAAEYLKLPRHAHSAALCGAVSAWQEELAGIQYNPAIRDVVIQHEIPVIASYSYMTLDRTHIGIDAATSIGSYLVTGISFNNFSVGDIEGRDSLGLLTENFDYRTNAVSVSVAGRLKWPISLGITARYLYEHLEKERANGFGFDVGATYRPLEQLCIGISGQNIGSKIWWTTGHDDPVLATARLGIAALFLDSTLIGELDVAKTLKQPIDVSFGIQYKLFNILSIRAGTSTSLDIEEHDYRDFDFAFGVGMRYSIFGFDYACPITSSKLGVSHKISVVVKIPTK